MPQIDGIDEKRKWKLNKVDADIFILYVERQKIRRNLMHDISGSKMCCRYFMV